MAADCTAMMALMMGGMNRGGDGRHWRRVLTSVALIVAAVSAA